MRILQENVRTFALFIVFAAIVAGGITWALFNADIALRYLYLSIGVFVAIGLIWQARNRLSQHDGSIHAQVWNTLVQQEAFSSVSRVLRVVLLFAKEAALRLTYWPFEACLMAIEDKLQGAPNVVARAAIVREFEPRIPVITAAWMLLINVVLLSLNAAV